MNIPLLALQYSFQLKDLQTSPRAIPLWLVSCPLRAHNTSFDIWAASFNWNWTFSTNWPWLHSTWGLLLWAQVAQVFEKNDSCFRLSITNCFWHLRSLLRRSANPFRLGICTKELSMNEEQNGRQWNPVTFKTDSPFATEYVYVSVSVQSYRSVE